MGYFASGPSFVVAVEPMHGNKLVLYYDDERPARVLTDRLTEGHALGCGDLLGIGADQIVVGWRGRPGAPGSTTGLSIWTSLDVPGKKWRETTIDPEGMACEDLRLSDLDGDGRVDIIAAGRATKNVVIYWNETEKTAK